MVRLKGYCGEYLERFLNAENCLEMKEIAEKFSMTELAKTAVNFVKNNLGDVINHEMMMDLPMKRIEKFVTEKAWNVPMDAAVKVMSRWVCHDLSTRERDFKHLLTLINWTVMEPSVIIDYIDQEPLYGSSERCFYYVLHSLALKGIQVQKYEQMYQALQQRFAQVGI
jgi:kelch-like protein 11